MKRIVICLVFVVLFVGFANAQTKSVTGEVIDENSGASGRYDIRTITVGGKRYSFFIFSADGKKSHNPEVIGDVGIGKTVRVYYSQIVSEGDGYALTATKVVEVKKPKTPAKKTVSNTCKFCGTWQYRESQSDFYLRITEVGTNKFRLSPGSVGVGGQIYWLDSGGGALDVRNADGIYLRSVNGKLVGSFASINFRTTGGAERTYKITCQLKPNGKMVYTVTSSGFTERYVATKIN